MTDTYSGLVASTGDAFTLDDSAIVWPSDAAQYQPSGYSTDQVVAPPSWRSRPDVNADGSYVSLPDLSRDAHFQVWMRVAGLPTFRKLWARITPAANATTTTVSLKAGSQIQLTINDNYANMAAYNGKKAIVISGVSWIGGKNSFLGAAYISVGCIALVFALLFLLKAMISPRRIGDARYLSWNAGTTANTDSNNNNNNNNNNKD